ncbi:MAG: OB-fold domain-containing protein [Proteobacteria bacterium]|nr:OB-fold domain-containing protein [Pseudomonadota bacterium]MDA1135203.1 OB-fold domain-containing protein [Pseudomonadota bacterium]
MPENLTGSIGPEQQFKNYLSEGKFMIQKSKSLNKFFFHPRVAFPGTGERDLEWVEASGNGIVYSTSCNRRLPEKGGDFNISLITLQEGPRMMAKIKGVAPDQVVIGQKVKARISSLKGEPAIIFDIVEG